MIELTVPQIWTLMAVFATSMFAMIGIVTGSFTRVLRAEIGGMRGEMNAKFEAVNINFDRMRGEMDAKFDAVNTKFDAVNARFDRLEGRLDGLDRDVQALARKVFDRPE